MSTFSGLPHRAWPWTSRRGCVRRRVVAGWLCAGLLVLGLPRPTAHAQASAAEAEAEAKRVRYDALVREALEEYSLGHFREARSSMRAAHALSPNARTHRGLGMVAFELRDYRTARRHLEQALGDERKKLTSTQRAAVLDLLGRCQRYLGRYRLRIPASWVEPKVEVDEEETALGTDDELWLDLGPHVLQVRAAGGQRFTRQLEVRGGEQTELLIEDEAAVAEPPAEVSTAPAKPEVRTRPFRRWGIGLAAAGGGLLAAGLAVGGTALARSRAADSDVGPQADRARTLSVASDVLTLTAAATALAGLSLWLVRREGAPEGAWRLQPQWARGSVGASVHGRF